MAAKRVENPSGKTSWTGLSTDDKPITVGGADWLSIDTGERWLYHDGMWVFDLNSRKLTQSVYE